MHVDDVYGSLIRAGYYSDTEVPTMSQKMQRVKVIADEGMIVYADHTGIVAAITPIIIDLESEFVEKIESLTHDMPLLEDASDDDGLVFDLPSSEDDRLILEVTQPYAYTNNKAVPWCYDAEIDVVTRSGRTYAQTNSQPIKPVSDEEAKEFLAVIKASEYNVVDQLRKMPTQISLLELLQTSDKHQKSLLKVLSEVHVSESIEHEKLEEFVGSILLKDQIAFFRRGIPS